MIEAATGPVIYRIGTEELVRDGYLVPPVIHVVSTVGWWKPAAWGQVCRSCGAQRGWMSTDKGPRKEIECSNCGAHDKWRSEFQQAYTAEIVENGIRNMRIARIVQGKDPLVGPMEGATLVLVKQVKHGRLLQRALPGSEFLSGRDSGSDRLRVFNAIRAGVTDVLVATTIADLGLDLPALRNLVLAAGGKSTTRHLQRIGRVARPYPGKSFARVVDLDDGHIHDWFKKQAKLRRKIEKAEWGESAVWL
jgi:superfamily II DNA or RNA helicase